MSGQYTYLACDLVTGRVRERVELMNVTAERKLNEPGSFEALMPLSQLKMRDQYGQIVLDANGREVEDREAQRTWLDATAEARSTIVVLRDGVCLGEWIIWQRPTIENNSAPVQLSGRYITSYLDKVIPAFSTYTGDLPVAGWSAVDQITIARQVAAQAADPIPGHFAPAGARGLTMTIPAHALSGQLRDRTDEWIDQNKTVLEMLTDLSGVEQGFDWDIDVQVVNGYVVRTLNLGYPYRGRNAGLTLQPAQGRPGGNASHVAITYDGDRLFTQTIGLGAGQGDSQIISRQSASPDLIAAYPLLQQVYTDTTRTDQASMDEATSAQAMLAATTRVPPDVTVFADKEPVLGSYNCGDIVTLVMGKSSNFPVGYKQTLRILTIPIKPPAAAGGGPETVQLQVGTPPDGA